MSNTLTKKERLCGRSVISALFESNSTLFCYPFRCLWEVAELDKGDVIAENRADLCGATILFSIPKRKVKRANKRNLLKRRTKESYRLNKHSLVDSLCSNNLRANIAFIYISTDIIEYNKIQESIKTLLNEIEKLVK